MSRALSRERPSGYDLTSASESPASLPQALDKGERLDLVMAGPGLEVMGGVSAVERMILAELPEQVQAVHIATMVDGTRAKKALTFAGALWRFRADLARHPDLIHIHFASGASSVRKMMLASIALKRGIKVIMHAHGGAYSAYWERISTRRRAHTLDLLKQVSALIVLGAAWRDFFASIGVPPQKIVVMPNPVRLPPVVPQRPESTSVACAYLGIISQRKGAFDLVEAVALLPPQYRDRLRMTIAGNGQVERLRELVEQRGLAANVQVHEWLDAERRDALLASAHVFALPSYFEGLPMALLEAMAFGAVPISTPVGSIGEVLRHDVNGLLIAPGDVRALAASLQRLIDHPDVRARLAARARAAVEPLGIEVYIGRLCRLYRAVALGRDPGEVA